MRSNEAFQGSTFDRWNATSERVGNRCGSPPNICAFGDYFGIVVGAADPPRHLTRSVRTRRTQSFCKGSRVGCTGGMRATTVICAGGTPAATESLLPWVLVSMPIDSGKINFYAIWHLVLDLGFRTCSWSALTAEVLLNTKQPNNQRRLLE